MGKQRGSKKDTGAVQAPVSKPAKEPNALLLRNKSTTIHVLRADQPGVADVMVDLHSEVVVPPSWEENNSLLHLVEAGQIEMTPVHASVRPQVLPRITDAPADYQVENAFDREYARQITLKPEQAALDAVAVTAPMPDTGEPDVRYMKNRFLKILQLAYWLEDRTQKRAKVLGAIRERESQIRSL